MARLAQLNGAPAVNPYISLSGTAAWGIPMALSVWVHFFDDVPAQTRAQVAQTLADAAVEVRPVASAPAWRGLAVAGEVDATVLAQLRALAARGAVLAVATGANTGSTADMWELLAAGAADVVCWQEPAAAAAAIAARLARWDAVQALVDSDTVRRTLVGASSVWRSLVRSVAEIAAFTDSPVLITGETGTGKDLLAQMIHKLDRNHGRFIVLDCTTLSPELAGSELFGHERGAFTGATAPRDGAFALADGGVLFLDEVGELPLPLQAQLLRVIQEQAFKRVGSNHWQRTHFRLLCATNRDLEQEVAQGRFRADLFYRIAAWCCRTPPLRERHEDVLPLVHHFLAQLAAPAPAPPLDPAVREYFIARDYPGNVRELRQVVTRLWHRHTGPGPLTIGAVPPDERPAARTTLMSWPDRGFEQAIRAAVELGIPLARITQGAGDLAIQLVLQQEDDNNQRAAARLGVTDRALQIRRKGWARP
jgi:transcriptional regulator with GAF, ATPase, and Fis domain